VQLGEVVLAAGDDPAPERDVDVELALGGRALLVERGERRGRRQAVERHVDEGGDARAAAARVAWRSPPSGSGRVR
jgi:hypothetical protein